MTTTSIMEATQGTNRIESGFPQVPTRITDENSSSEAPTVIPEVVERLSTLETRLGTIHRLCSEAYVSQGKLEEALVHQSMAARMEPDQIEYRNQLGYLRYLTGDDGAAEDFGFVIERDPNNAEGHFNLAMIRFGQGDFLTARTHFAKAAEARPDDPEVWNNLGVALFQTGEPAEARRCFERALAIDPENEDARVNLSEIR